MNKAGVFRFHLMSPVFKRDPKCPMDQGTGHVHVTGSDVTLFAVLPASPRRLSFWHPAQALHAGTVNMLLNKYVWYAPLLIYLSSQVFLKIYEDSLKKC